MVQKNPWMISTAILAIALAIVSIYTLTIRTPAELTAEEAKNKAIDYINENLVQPGTRANAVSVEEVGSVYKILTEYEGDLIPVYITREGRYLFLTSPINTSQRFPTPTPTPTPTPEIKTEKLRQFIACLNQSGFKIYGAAWCSYCKQLVEMLGGYEMVKPVYVECTVEREECAKADIRAYPTIMINGTRYAGDRSIEAFSRATNCPPPY